MIIELNTPLPCSQIIDHPDMERPALCDRAGFFGLVSRLSDGAWELLPLCSTHYEEFIAATPLDASAHPEHVTQAAPAKADARNEVSPPVRVR